MCVAENDATLLSTSRADLAAAMTSTSRRVAALPLRDTTQIAPFRRMRVAVLDIDDAEILALIAERTTELTAGWPEPDSDVVLLGADSVEALGSLRELATRIRRNGAIWVVSRKGKAATIRDVDVMNAAKAAALVDNKVASFDEARTSLRLVIPVALRPAR